MATFTGISVVNTAPIIARLSEVQLIGDGPRMTIGDCLYVAAPTGSGGATYPTVPVGSRLLVVVQSGKLVAVTPT